MFIALYTCYKNPYNIGTILSGKFVWKRDNNVIELCEPITKRKVFSWSGQMIGHYPVAEWLRPACSFLKRSCGTGAWDEEVPETAKHILKEIQDRVSHDDPVKGQWSVVDKDEGIVWADASSLAIGVAIEIQGNIVEDGCWLRKENDSSHINLAELESIIKGINLALQWKLRNIEIRTDSKTVHSWLSSLLTGDRRIKTKCMSEALVRRRLSLIQEIITEYNLKLTVTWISTNANLADRLTRVPQKWLKRNVCNVTMVPESTVRLIEEDQVLSVHNEHHFGVEKTKHFLKLHFPEHEIDSAVVKKVISNCSRCQSIDPNSIQWKEGHLHVRETWKRLAMDVTHFEGDRFLTIIDCGPSRFAIWRKIRDESSQSIISELKQIFYEFGPPVEILVDNATNFKSEQFKGFCNTWKVNTVNPRYSRGLRSKTPRE